jgi:hypothetical protein
MFCRSVPFLVIDNIGSSKLILQLTSLDAGFSVHAMSRGLLTYSGSFSNADFAKQSWMKNAKSLALNLKYASWIEAVNDALCGMSLSGRFEFSALPGGSSERASLKVDVTGTAGGGTRVLLLRMELAVISMTADETYANTWDALASAARSAAASELAARVAGAQLSASRRQFALLEQVVEQRAVSASISEAALLGRTTAALRSKQDRVVDSERRIGDLEEKARASAFYTCFIHVLCLNTICVCDCALQVAELTEALARETQALRSLQLHHQIRAARTEAGMPPPSYPLEEDPHDGQQRKRGRVAAMAAVHSTGLFVNQDKEEDSEDAKMHAGDIESQGSSRSDSSSDDDNGSRRGLSDDEDEDTDAGGLAATAGHTSRAHEKHSTALAASAGDAASSHRQSTLKTCTGSSGVCSAVTSTAAAAAALSSKVDDPKLMHGINLGPTHWLRSATRPHAIKTTGRRRASTVAALSRRHAVHALMSAMYHGEAQLQARITALCTLEGASSVLSSDTGSAAAGLPARPPLQQLPGISHVHTDESFVARIAALEPIVYAAFGSSIRCSQRGLGEVFAAGHANTLIKRVMFAWNCTVVSTLHHFVNRTSSHVGKRAYKQYSFAFATPVVPVVAQ